MTYITMAKQTDPAAGGVLQAFLLELLGIDPDDIDRTSDVGILGVSPSGFAIDTGGSTHLLTIPIQMKIDSETAARIVELLAATGDVDYEHRGVTL